MKKADKFDQMIDQVIEERLTTDTAIAFWVGINQEIEYAENTGERTVAIDAIIGKFEKAMEYAANKKQ
ncbi:hypothetical protein LC048_21110 [Mesobacillus subterraneus]|uniref:hypothetical protein n=1 Tax=Mesobacillus subterraneus TaxID=285983 RepID=UPI001CFD7DEA|nr:hypothetical protein [Mesobacillus subterraneus]WLR54865.1 hypothetical protein LC048_21110 [Mesobacillus subterraneus]